MAKRIEASVYRAQSVLAILFVLLFAAAAPAADIYVAPGGTGDGTIASPDSLEDALGTAESNGQDDTIYLQAGTYSAADGFLYEAIGTDTTRLTLSGGWDAGYAVQGSDRTATQLDGQTTRRVLKVTGDGPGVDIIFALENLTIQNGRTNTYTPAPGETGYGAGISAMNLNGSLLKLVMDECLVRDNATLNASSAAGGLYITCDYGLQDVIFTGNQTPSNGGAIASTYFPPYTSSLAPTIENCWFEANLSGSTWAGAHINTTVSPVVTYTTFKGKADGGSSGGSGINIIYGASPRFEACSFLGNVSNIWGGAMQFYNSGAVIRNCLFAGNKAGALGSGASGGAISTFASANSWTVEIINSTFVDNLTLSSSLAGGAIHNRAQTVNVTNSIFWGNGAYYPATLYTGGTYALTNTGTANISYSDAQGGLTSTNFTAGSGNIDQDPLFVAADPEYHLQSTSPCVDAGSNAAIPTDLPIDFEEDLRIFAGPNNRAVPTVDMGWDEYYDGGLEFTAPAEGAVLLNDNLAKSITWACTNIGGNVRLYLWQGERYTGSEVLEIAASVPCANQAYSWTIPAGLPDASDYALAMDSLLYETIGHGRPVTIQHLKLTAPNGGQALRQGAVYKIKWQSGNLPGATVRIQLYRGAKRVAVIAAAAANTGVYKWTIPYTLLPAGTYRIKISTASPLVALDWSDAEFSIVPAVTVTSPNGGEIWKRGTAHAVTWSYKGIPGAQVQIDLYKGGVFKSTLAAAAPIGSAGTGSWLWAIPATLGVGTDYAIRVKSTTYPNCFDQSNAVFKIRK